MSGQYRIVFHLPGQTKSYYRRHVECRRNGLPATKPEITTDVADAAKFTSLDLLTAARSRFRADFPRFTIFIEDLAGNGPLFEPRQVEPTTEDHRTPMWVVEDQDTFLGFLTVPAWSPTLGRCFALRSSDVPAIVASRRHEVLETIYAETPEAAVQRGKELWGSLMVPFANPQFEAQAQEEIKQFAAEIKNHGKTGRPRPGDL